MPGRTSRGSARALLPRLFGRPGHASCAQGWRSFLPWLGASLVAGLGALAWPFTVDDAFVLARYAERIARGAGYTMNDGPPTDGITGPLALIPALAGELGWGDPVGASKLVGLATTALAVALVVRAAGRRSTLEALVTLALAAAGSTIAVWSVGGLETGLATLAMTLAVLAVTTCVGAEAAARDRRLGVLAGLSIAALAWLRPELAVASGVLLVALARSSARAARIAWSLALLGAASVVAFRLAMFGAPLPLSAQAKPPDLANGAEYVVRALVLALGGGGAVVAWLAAREGGRGERLVAGVLLAHLVALVLSGGDWMPGFRLLAPLLPSYALLVARPIALRLATRGRRAWGVAALAGCLAIPVLDSALQFGPVREAGAQREAAGSELARWLAAHAERVAMVDVGYVAYRSGVEVVDLGGITDPAIGRLPGGHLDKRLDPGLLRERAPDVLVLHASAPPRVDSEGRLASLAGYPVERRVAAMAWVRAEYRVARVIRYSADYYYVVLVRSPNLARSALRWHSALHSG